MNYKITINNLITSRYNYLLGCATNVLNKNFNTCVEPHDLIAELTLYLHTHKPKVTEYIKINRLEAFCVSWINIQGKYATSQINKKYNTNHYELDEFTINNLVHMDIDYTKVEKGDYERDLHNIFTDGQVDKIMSIDKIIDKLTKSEMILFKAYFIEDLSYDKIVKKYTFFREKDGKRINYKSKKSIYTLMKALKEKIHSLIEENEITK